MIAGVEHDRVGGLPADARQRQQLGAQRRALLGQHGRRIAAVAFEQMAGDRLEARRLLIIECAGPDDRIASAAVSTAARASGASSPASRSRSTAASTVSQRVCCTSTAPTITSICGVSVTIGHQCGSWPKWP